MALEVGAQERIGLVQADFLLRFHGDKLPAPGGERLQEPPCGRQRPARGQGQRCAHRGQHAGIHPIGLADDAAGPREVPRPRRIGAAIGHTGRLQRIAQRPGVTPGRLEDDEGLPPRQPPRKGPEAAWPVVDLPVPAAGIEDVQPVFRDVDSDDQFMHDSLLSLSVRGLLTQPLTGAPPVHGEIVHWTISGKPFTPFRLTTKECGRLPVRSTGSRPGTSRDAVRTCMLQQID